MVDVAVVDVVENDGKLGRGINVTAPLTLSASERVSDACERACQSAAGKQKIIGRQMPSGTSASVKLNGCASSGECGVGNRNSESWSIFCVTAIGLQFETCGTYDAPFVPADTR